MKENIISSLRLTIVCLIFFSGIYTMMILGFAKVLPGNGKGEIITNEGKKYYSADSEIPSDLVTASGGGLDPHISVQAATVQIKRISKIRGIAEGNLQQLVISNTEEPLLGFLGTEKINVLKLNIALDNLK